MDANLNRVNETEERAREEARAQLASIQDMVACLEHAESCTDSQCGADCPHDVEEAREGILQDPLSVEVRGAWHTPGAFDAAAPFEYRILLCWGGPAVRLIGELDDRNAPYTAKLQHQDWFTPWSDYPLTQAEEATLVKYAEQFYFDE